MFALLWDLPRCGTVTYSEQMSLESGTDGLVCWVVTNLQLVKNTIAAKCSKWKATKWGVSVEALSTLKHQKGECPCNITVLRSWRHKYQGLGVSPGAGNQRED